MLVSEVTGNLISDSLKAREDAEMIQFWGRIGGVNGAKQIAMDQVTRRRERPRHGKAVIHKAVIHHEWVNQQAQRHGEETTCQS